MGLSCRDMLRALIEGEENSARLAEFARGRLRRKQDQLQSALEGSIGQHQRFMLGHLLQHIEFVDRQIEQLSGEIEARMRPYEAHMESLQRIPGIGRA